MPRSARASLKPVADREFQGGSRCGVGGPPEGVCLRGQGRLLSRGRRHTDAGPGSHAVAWLCLGLSGSASAGALGRCLTLPGVSGELRLRLQWAPAAWASHGVRACCVDTRPSLATRSSDAPGLIWPTVHRGRAVGPRPAEWRMRDSPRARAPALGGAREGPRGCRGRPRGAAWSVASRSVPRPAPAQRLRRGGPLGGSALPPGAPRPWAGRPPAVPSRPDH